MNAKRRTIGPKEGAIILSALFSMSRASRAVQFDTWTGAISQSWATRGNWSSSGTSPLQDSVVTIQANSGQTTNMDIGCTISQLQFGVAFSVCGIDGNNSSVLTFDGVTAPAAIYLQANTTTLNLGSSGSILPILFTGNTSIDFANSSQVIADAGSVEGSGSLFVGTPGTFSGPGTLRFNANDPSYSGTVTIDSGKVVLSTSGGIGSGSVILNGGTLSLQSSATSFSNAIAANVATGNAFDVPGIASTASGYLTGSGGFTKTGSGTLTLSHTNSYSGGNSIVAGMLQLGSVSGVGSGSVTVGSGTIFNVAGFAPVIATLSGAGSVTLGSGTLTAGDSTATTFSGVISGTGKFIKQGSGSITFSGNNTYSGGTSITAGVLVIGGDANLGAAPGSPATSLTFSGSGGTLQVSGDVTLNANRNVLLSSNATFDTNGHALTIPGTLTGSGSLTEIGGGTLALTNYTTSAGTTVSNGILLMSGTNNSFAGITGTSGSLTIASSAAAVSDGVQLATLTVTGSHAIRANGTASGVSKVTTLSIAGSTGAWTGTLDINDNLFVVEAPDSTTKAADITTLQDQVRYGLAHMLGLVSSTLPLTTNTAIAIADNAASVMGKTTMRAQPLDSESILVVQALEGDTNLDGTVNAADLLQLDKHYGTADSNWTDGDFNYDGTVDGTDLLNLLKNYNMSYGTFSLLPGKRLSPATAAVPEPAMLGVVCLGIPLLGRRRTSRRR